MLKNIHEIITYAIGQSITILKGYITRYGIKFIIVFSILLPKLVYGNFEEINRINTFLKEQNNFQQPYPKVVLQYGLDKVIYSCKHPELDIVATSDGKAICVWDMSSNRIVSKKVLVFDDDLVITNIHFGKSNVLSVGIGQVTYVGSNFFFEGKESYISQVNRHGKSDTFHFDPKGPMNFLGFTTAAIPQKVILYDYVSEKHINIKCKALWINPYKQWQYLMLINKDQVISNDSIFYSEKSLKRQLTKVAFWRDAGGIILGFDNGDVEIRNTEIPGIAQKFNSGVDRVTDIICHINLMMFTIVGDDYEDMEQFNYLSQSHIRTIEIPKTEVGNASTGVYDNYYKYPKPDPDKPRTWYQYKWNEDKQLLLIVSERNRIIALDFKKQITGDFKIKEFEEINTLEILNNGTRCFIVSSLDKPRDGIRELKYLVDILSNDTNVILGRNPTHLFEEQSGNGGKVMFSEDEKSVWLSDVYTFTSWDLQTLNREWTYFSLIDSSIEGISKIINCPNQKFILIASKFEYHILDPSNGNKDSLNFSFLNNADVPQSVLTYDLDKDLLYTVWDYRMFDERYGENISENLVTVWNSDGKVLKRFRIGQSIMEDQCFRLSESGKWMYVENSRKGTVEIYSVPNFKKVISIPVMAKSKEIDKWNHDTYVSFSADESTVSLATNIAYTIYVEKEGNYESNWKAIYTYQLDHVNSKATLTSKVDYTGSIQAMAHNPLENELFIIREEKGVATLETLRGIQLLRHSRTQYVDQTVRSIIFSPKGSLMVLKSFDRMRFVNMSDDSLQFDLHAFSGDDGYDAGLFISKEGFYKANKSTLESISFSYQGKAYPYQLFDLYLNRPDYVIRKSHVADPTYVTNVKRARIKRGAKLDASLTFQDVVDEQPTIKMLKTPRVYSTQDTVMMVVSCVDSRTELDRIKVYLNGVPVFSEVGLPIKKSQRLDTTLLIPLCNGRNDLEISVVNKNGLSSIPAYRTFQIEQDTSKPALYYIGLGGAKMLDQTLNLRYADNDVRNFVDSIRAISDQFSLIRDTVITNESMTQKNILGLKKWLMNSTINDKVIVYYSGHGYLTSEMQYFLTPYEFDINNPTETGLSIDEFESLVDEIPALDRLVLLNACYSGEVDDDYKSFKRMQRYFVDLRKGNGASIISASSTAFQASETALNSDNWDYGDNSLFGSLLLSCMKSKHGDANTIYEYLYDEMPKKNWNTQQPTFRQLNSKTTFRIW